MTNVTWWDNASNPADVFIGVINSTNGYFAIGLMVSVFFISVIALRARNRDFDEIFIFTGALEFMLAVFSIANKFIDFYWIMFPVALLFAGIMINRFGQD